MIMQLALAMDLLSLTFVVSLTASIPISIRFPAINIEKLIEFGFVRTPIGSILVLYILHKFTIFPLSIISLALLITCALPVWNYLKSYEYLVLVTPLVWIISGLFVYYDAYLRFADNVVTAFTSFVDSLSSTINDMFSAFTDLITTWSTHILVGGISIIVVILIYLNRYSILPAIESIYTKLKSVLFDHKTVDVESGGIETEHIELESNESALENKMNKELSISEHGAE